MRSQDFARKLFAVGMMMSAAIHQTMAQQTNLVPVQSGTTQIQQFLQPTNVDHFRNSQVLGIPTSHCGHVIDLLMTNRQRQQTNNIGTDQVYLPHLTVGVTPGDLELQCVHLVCDGDIGNGPIFQIEMKNNSQVPIGNFRVSLVGVLGQIHVHSPTATVCISRMEASDVTQIQVQLPVTCMSLNAVGSQAPFDTLIVAVDSFDELLECNELNNVQILKRCEIPLLVAETVVTPDTVPTEAAPIPAPAQRLPDVPTENEASPLDNLDLDNLNLNEAQNLLFRSR